MKNQIVYNLGLVTLFTGIFTFTNQKAFAQLIPDNTLGAESSQVNNINSTAQIENGATRGINLFHSFQEFNVDVGKTVNFVNPINIENILTRVTGNNVSNILGTLGVNGNANLFLINPNGIYFGNGAKLNIQGSFTATTADEIKLGDTGLFSAKNPQNSNLLSIQPNALFTNALKNQQAEIKNQGNLQTGQNLTFFSSNVQNIGELTAPGTIQLTGAENLFVRGNINTSTLFLETQNLNIGENNTETIDQLTLEKLDGNTNLIFQASNDITINPLTNNILTFAPGTGEITFTADYKNNDVGNFNMKISEITNYLMNDYSLIDANTINTNGRNLQIKANNINIGSYQGGKLNLEATGNINIGGDITTQREDIIISAVGNIQDMSISTLEANGGDITLISSQGYINPPILSSYGGNVKLAANGNIDAGRITTGDFHENSTEKGGNIDITSYQGSISIGKIKTEANTSGDINIIAAGDIILDSYAYYISAFSYEKSGNINITSNQGNIHSRGFIDNTNELDSIPYNLNKSNHDSFIKLNAAGNIIAYNNIGSSGDIFLTTKLGSIISDQGNIFTDQGDVQLDAANNIESGQIAGKNISLKANYDINTDSLFANDILIHTGKNYLNTNAAIIGNNIEIDAGEKIAITNTIIQSNSENINNKILLQSSNIELNNTDINMTALDNSVNKIYINSTGDIKLKNSRLLATLEPGSMGIGGDITIQAQNLNLTDFSLIDTGTYGNGKGGNINIQAENLFLTNDSSIRSLTTHTGNAGNLFLDVNNFVFFRKS
ncbi:filamentous hemagglutinin N-terminal domain-containing protein [Anabaena sp. UHCC 0253]|uniref:two-partner secretion domain-containing protein n=1 Tax=Anabaena sp. UHCC 0253 TaxID=2590019 RepID=UPI0014450062|nr:filamentous hemagglutinin N-terminal domain-containing protein [Anabaena sp. UHCC 0253]MTJ53015.1 filamentous hemagglutinin N-terminal domain-containing protein [Anabaena sp. UHCC 0253]